ncbi:MAG: hypothetical protein OXC46_11325 [Thaumarchaeota archaeon]|nr:hypothetical protein [Nitrososphaerota archaeon]
MDGQKMSEFITSIIPNTARMAIYYTPKPILRILNNPKPPQICHSRRTYRTVSLNQLISNTSLLELS